MESPIQEDNSAYDQGMQYLYPFQAGTGQTGWMSLTTHQQVDLTFTQKNISCQIQDKNIKYVLPEGCYFSHLKKIYFNKNGNINQANHIMIHLKNNQIKLVFHLGNGDFCFES